MKHRLLSFRNKMGPLHRLLMAFLLIICVDINRSEQNETDFVLPESFMDYTELDPIGDIDIVNKNTIIPDNLNDTCSLLSDVNKTYSFYCEINKNNSGFFDFSRIRHWISNSDYQFKFDINCEDLSKIAVPWPVKARNILQIKINRCCITGFFKDYGNPLIENMKDYLQVLEVKDSVVLIGLEDLMSLMIHFRNLTEDYNCGNDISLHTWVYRNITYKFKEDELRMLKKGQAKPSDDEIIDSGTNMIANTRSVDIRCTFQNLKILDQSTSDSKSRYNLAIQTEQSTFPELILYNLSNTGQVEIGNEFQQWYRFFPKLKTLDLSYNFISTIDLDLTANYWTKHNMNINLTYNNITELSRQDLELLGGINNLFVDIRNNPLHCICSDHMLEVFDVLEDETKWHALQLGRYEYIKMMTCDSPEHFKGRKLGTIKKSELACQEYVATSSVTPIVILSLTIVILLVIIVLLTKFRKEIFILTYTRFHIILPCQPAHVSDNKTYDAFVSYSNHDEEWVSKTFKDLELCNSDNYHQFKFCLHHRDFIPGKTIFDNVIDSVESSRHTVIILSRYFLQSHYCMYEFHEAFQQSIIERKRHMVVVLMENIPEDELPTDLKRCLKTFTYIRKDDSIFTDRLIYAMSHKPRRDSKSNVKKDITQVHNNAGFISEKEGKSENMIQQCQNDNTVITLSQIVPDLVIGHNDNKQL